jgi:3',5'-cyclic AMP phosphodiesterase CpdA
MDMDNNCFTRGSEWRKWDLHLHTKSSYDYIYNGEDADDLLVSALQKCSIAAVCITDHFVIDKDRIEKLRELAPEIVFFPGVELRTDKGDTNIHVILIFDKESNLDILSEDFNVFKRQKGKFIDNYQRTYWDFNDITAFAKEHDAIITIHAGRKSNGVDDRITNALETNQAVKEEYASKIDIFEMGQYRDLENYRKYVFPEIGEKPMIICSDNHDPRNYEPSQTLWIKADITFSGLKQVFEEPENRVFIGEEPELFTNVNNNRTKYIHELSIDAVEGYSGLQGKWFQNIKIPFNKELVAIIGNKGNGKSAVADILAHCCNFKNQQYFSFLTDKKFKNKNLADNFIATVEFEDKHKETKRLSDKLTDSNLPLVEYLPQGYFETICNDLQKEESLKSEIENVVFQYLDESLRLGASNFKELIGKKTIAANNEIVILKNKLSAINKEIIGLEDKENPEYRNQKEALISKREQEINALIKPQEVEKPNLEDDESKKLFEQIKELKNKNKSFETEFQSLLTEKNQIAHDISTIETFFSKLDSLAKAIKEFKQDNKQFIESMGENIDEIISVNIDKSSLNKKLSEKELRNKVLEELLKNDTKDANSPILKIAANTKRIEELQANLDGPSKAYHAYLQKLEEYNKYKKTIEGNEDSPNTLLWLRHEIDYLDRTLKADLSTKYEARDQILKEIFQNKNRF